MDGALQHNDFLLHQTQIEENLLPKEDLVLKYQSNQNVLQAHSAMLPRNQTQLWILDLLPITAHLPFPLPMHHGQQLPHPELRISRSWKFLLAPLVLSKQDPWHRML